MVLSRISQSTLGEWSGESEGSHPAGLGVTIRGYLEGLDRYFVSILVVAK